MSTKNVMSVGVLSNNFFTITDLIDLEKIQEIQDVFAEANGVAVTLTDANGVPVTQPSNYSKVCDQIRATEKGRAKCMISGKELGLISIQRQCAVHHQCLSIGFTDAAAPIIVQGKHIANWVIGQCHVGNVDESRVREYAKEIGAKADEMVLEFQKMPKMGLQEFEKKLLFLEVMARELALMGYQNLIQRQQNTELSQIKVELEKYQSRLESLVAERTAELQRANQELAKEIAQKNKMQRRQSRLVTAIESAAESICITSLSGRIIYVNPAFEDLTGYSLQEVIGKTPSILQSGLHDTKFYEHLWQTISSGSVWRGNFTNKRKDGTLYQEEATISPVKSSQGKLLNYVAVKRDITKELDLERQLHQSQKLEAIGVLAAGMAHELNTPIQYVLGNTSFLKEAIGDFGRMQACYDSLAAAVAETGDFAQQRNAITELQESIGLEDLKSETVEAVEQALAGVHQISTIVSAMSTFAESGALDKQPENLNKLIQNAVEISRGQWQGLAEVECDLEESLPLVPLLTDRFKLVFLEMMFNAVFALKEKQKVCLEKKGKITITTRSRANLVEICLTDTGIGIPETIIDKIFDPFFTTKQVRQGSGQGLAAAHSLIEGVHKGTLRVSSTRGEGTTFTITLPLN